MGHAPKPRTTRDEAAAPECHAGDGPGTPEPSSGSRASAPGSGVRQGAIASWWTNGFAQARAAPGSAFAATIGALVAMVQAGLRLVACETRSIHWDEFNFLAVVHEAARGELSVGFQTFHARLFFWLPLIGTNEVDQVIAARYVIWVIHLGTLVVLATIGTRLIGGAAALWAICQLGATGYVIQHGCSFRYDALVAFSYVLALWFLLGRSRASIGGAAASSALALAFSLKAALFSVPTLGFLLTARGGDAWGGARQRLARFGAWGIAAGATLLGLHWMTLVPPPTRAATFGDFTGGMFSLTVPRSLQLGITLEADGTAWYALGVGLAALLGTLAIRRGEAQRRAALVLLTGVPLFSVLVYRNAWPYFIATVMTTAALWMAYLPGVLVGSARTWLRRTMLAGLIFTAARAGVVSWGWHVANDSDQTSRQREVIQAAKTIFPEPVPYIDRCAMISSYPKVGPFMSSLMMERYRAAGKPMFASLLRQRQPRLLLANVDDLDLRYGATAARRPSGHALFDEDFAALNANFLHHWGPIWVAGKEFEVEAGRWTRLDFPIAGTYTLEADQTLEVDAATTLRPGASLELGQGEHSFRAERSGSVRLRIGASLLEPTMPPPEGNLLEGFRFNPPELSWPIRAAFVL